MRQQGRLIDERYRRIVLQRIGQRRNQGWNDRESRRNRKQRITAGRGLDKRPVGLSVIRTIFDEELAFKTFAHLLRKPARLYIAAGPRIHSDDDPNRFGRIIRRTLSGHVS